MATAARRFKIVDLTVIPSAEPGRIGKKDAIITYQDEAMRVRVLTIPNESIEGKSEEEVITIIANAIKAQEAERARYIGREITL
jgi:hypothetical protein